MPVGNQPTVVGINQSLTSYAVQLRELMHQLADFNKQVQKLGLSGLQALPPPPGQTSGYSAADAQSVLDRSSLLDTFPGIYNGQATQGTTFDFNDALSPLWGGQ